MEAVLISIQPKWCELIASGKKTVEVRKTKPKLETPFKVYIYCTASNVHECLMVNEYGAKLIIAMNYKTAIPCGGWIGNGKIIGEFVCDVIYPINYTLDGFAGVVDVRTSCMKPNEFVEYGQGKPLYAWHISDLVIYEKPKELSEFFIFCGDNPKCDGCEAYYYSNTENGIEEECCSVVDGCRPLKRPPQSWCYVDAPDTNVGKRKEDKGK